MGIYKHIKQEKSGDQYLRCEAQLQQLTGLLRDLLNSNLSDKQLHELSGYLDTSFECLGDHSAVVRCDNCEGVTVEDHTDEDGVCSGCLGCEWDDVLQRRAAERYSDLALKSFREGL